MASASLDLLWKNIQKDNIKSFAALYQLTYKKLGNLCYKIVDDEEVVKDILQESYVSLYQKKNDLPEDLNVEAYLYKTVKYSAFKYLRDVLSKKQALIVPYQADYEYEDCAQPQAGEGDLYDDNLMDNVMGSIAELPDRCRNAFVLKYFNNMSYQEISEKMDISPKTVEKHVHYGLSILRKKFPKDQLLLVAILLEIIIW